MRKLGKKLEHEQQISEETVLEYMELIKRCEDCGGNMEWCSCCEMYTQTCCIEYGTCMCS